MDALRLVGMHLIVFRLGLVVLLHVDHFVARIHIIVFFLVIVWHNVCKLLLITHLSL